MKNACLHFFHLIDHHVNSHRHFYEHVLLWLLWVLLSIIVIVGFRKHALSFAFQDETDHVAVGAAILEKHQVLYRDIITIHQPLPVLIGGAIAHIADRSTLFSLVSQVRLLMGVIWLIGGTLLIIRFGWLGLIANLGFGVMSHLYFGFQVLSESLIFPALTFVILSLSEKIFNFSTRPKKWHPQYDWLVWGFSCFYLIFNLLPLAPLIIIATLVYWYYHRQQWWQIALSIVSGFCLPTLLLFLYINPIAWWQQTVLNVIYYWLPADAPVYNVQKIARIFLLPFLSHWWLPVVALLFPLCVWIREKKWRLASKLVFMYLLACTLNLRTPNELGGHFWAGFHTFPYVLALWSAIIASWWSLLTSGRCTHDRTLAGVLLAVWALSTGNWLWQKVERNTEYYIQYSPQQAAVNVINILKQDGDTLFTAEDGFGYMNLVTGLPFADKQNFHLAWAWRSPELREDFYHTFTDRPPAFVYFKPASSGTDNYLAAIRDVLSREYYPLLGPGGSQTDLYLRRNIVDRVTPSQWADYRATLWELPTELELLISAGN